MPMAKPGKSPGYSQPQPTTTPATSPKATRTAKSAGTSTPKASHQAPKSPAKKPGKPEKPVIADQPVKAVEIVETVKALKAVKPVKPGKALKAVKPIKPVKPVKTQKPAKTEKPVKAVKAVKQLGKSGADRPKSPVKSTTLPNTKKNGHTKPAPSGKSDPSPARTGQPLKPLAAALRGVQAKVHDGVRKFLLKTEGDLIRIINFLEVCGSGKGNKELDVIPPEKAVKEMLRKIRKAESQLDSGKWKGLAQIRELLKFLQKRLVIP